MQGSLLQRYRSIFFLILGSIMVSAATPVIAKLVALGNEHPMHGRNPVSFCNVLFAGNAVALVVFLLIYQKELRRVELRKMGARGWMYCLAEATLAGFLFPSLFFFGILYTDVINVVIISTLEIPFTMLVGWLIFREKFGAGVIVGACITLAGVLVTQVLQDRLGPGKVVPTQGPIYAFLASTAWSGEVCLLLSIVFKVISIFLTRQAIAWLSPGFFNVFKVAAGTVIFFCIVVAMFGWAHFGELFSPFLWQWMVLYGAVIVALRSYVRYLGLQGAEAADIAISSAIVPLFAIFFAYLILGEVPSGAEWLGGSLTLVGVAWALYFKVLEKEKAVLQKPVGFAGI